MYTLATNKINNAYQLVMLYELTLPDGTVREKIASKKVKSGTPFSKRELAAISHVWLNDVLIRLQGKYRSARFRVIEIQIECYLINKAGNELVVCLYNFITFPLMLEIYSAMS